MTRRVASLGMYDHPAQHDANDRLWAEIARILRARGISDVPDALDRTRDVHAIWRDPALLFGQACGYPLVADPTLTLRVLALPIYEVPGGGSATHGSVLVARADDGRQTLAAYRGTRAAINDPRSNTGVNLFRATIAALADGRPFFDDVVVTGSHRDSMIAVASGTADIAAIDTVTDAALARFEPALTRSLKIVAQSPASPTLPFVTAAATSIETVAALRIALDLVLADPGLADVRASLFLSGAVPASAAMLAPIEDIAATAAAAGYPELR